MEFIQENIYQKAIDYAKENEHTQIVELLSKAEKEINEIENTNERESKSPILRTTITEEEKEELIKKNDELEEELQKSKEEIDELEEELQKSKEEIDELEEKLQKSEEENDQLKKYISALKEKSTEIKYVKVEDYEEEGTIGKGSTSVVKLVHKKEQEKYAKKELTDIDYEAMQRFVREGDILIKLRHPCIIEIVGINLGNNINPPSLFLPFEPESLEAAIKNHKLNEHQINKICVELVLGMRFIHKKKFMHRDLKPNNILLDINKHVRISDFGLSKEDSFEISQTKGIGTLRFMAPELFEDSEEEESKSVSYTNKVDVYSFGITMIFILTGTYPKFNMKSVVNGQIPKIPQNVVDWVGEMILRCLSFSPENRPSFNEILEIMKENNFDLFNENAKTKLSSKQRENKKDIETRILEIEAFEYQHRDD